jgi:predicted transcriptional regulator
LKRARTLKESDDSAPIFHDHVICLECGKTMRRLRRHLATAHDRFGLRHDHAYARLPDASPFALPRRSSLSAVRT